MIKLFRNVEVLRSVIAFIIISLASVIAVWIYDERFLVPVMIICFLFTLVHFITLYLRYKRISDLTADIDRILHGEGNVHLEKYAEGELALLQSEVYKMTIRLREQQSKLMDDKM